ncbi:MAG: PP2C family protein-serine/threonine phosphatase, partial [Gemmata sp.]
MSPATVLWSAPAGRASDEGLRALARAAGFALADHALGSAPAIDFGPVVVAVVEVGDRTEVAAAQTRRWRAELGDEFLPVLWLADRGTVPPGLDAGADVVLARPVEGPAFAAQLRALGRAQGTAARVAARAGEARLLGDQLKKALAQLDREQDMARRLRATFLPKSFPQVGGARFHVRARVRNRAGGDFHDVRRVDEHHVGFFVGDVVGTGVSAGGLLGALVHQSAVLKEITGHTYRVVPPNEVLANVNRSLVEWHVEELQLVAMLCGVLTARAGTFALAR